MICFLINVYKDIDLTIRNIKDIQKIYSDKAEILIVSDCLIQNDFKYILDNLQINYLEAEHIKHNTKFKGLWTQRYLNYFLDKSKLNILIKIDPDSKINKPFTYIPNADIFGSLRLYNNEPYIQGGAIGFKRKTVETIVNSNLLINNNYKYIYYRQPKSKNELSIKLSCQDKLLYKVIEKLGLTISNWTDCNCYGMWEKPILSSADLDYSIVHPYY